MVDVCPDAQAELFTVSTPSTIETTVEASGILSSQGELGGAGGKEGAGTEKPPEPAGALDAGWARALHSRAACQLGRCAYADPTKRPNRSIGAQGCDGYHASRSLDDGRPTVRWGLCPRHREWWRLERIRQSAAKAPRSPHAGLGPER